MKREPKYLLDIFEKLKQIESGEKHTQQKLTIADGGLILARKGNKWTYYSHWSEITHSKIKQLHELECKEESHGGNNLHD